MNQYPGPSAIDFELKILEDSHWALWAVTKDNHEEMALSYFGLHSNFGSLSNLHKFFLKGELEK